MKVKNMVIYLTITFLLILNIITPTSYAEQDTIYVIFVWHHHQGINIWSNAVYHGPWAYIHTYKDEFTKDYKGGAYYIHAYLLMKHPRIKMVYHLSPSLLWQWNYALKYGYLTAQGTYVAPSDVRLQKVNETLKLYQELVREGRIEILSDYFNHPIPGYIAFKYEWGKEILREELRWGLNVTREVMKVDVDGVWTPEMSFCMRIGELYAEEGIKYTVLDGKHHFSSAEGDKGTIYEPYLLNTSSGMIYVFFRDQELSDYIGFQTKFKNKEEADAAAKGFVERILSLKEVSVKPKLLVLALDGENWMYNSPYTAYFLDKLMEYLEERYPEIQTITLREAVNMSKNPRILTYIPLNSWAGGHWVWTSKGENMEQWNLINKAASDLMKIKEKYGEKSLVYHEALFSMFLTLNSDVIHKEYTYLTHTRAWSKEVYYLLIAGEKEAERLNKLGLNLRATGKGPTSLDEAGSIPVYEENHYWKLTLPVLAFVISVIVAWLYKNKYKSESH